MRRKRPFLRGIQPTRFTFAYPYGGPRVKQGEPAIDRYTRWLVFATITSVIVAAITAYILFKTDETTRLRDRAFVYFTPGDVLAVPYPVNHPDALALARFSVMNAGNMPARKVKIKIACVTSRTPLWDTFKGAHWYPIPAQNVVGPKQVLSYQGCGFPISEFLEAEQAQRHLYFLVEAEYLDGFELDKARKTQMSLVFQFDKHGGRSLGMTPSRNCTDEDCPG